MCDINDDSLYFANYEYIRIPKYQELLTGIVLLGYSLILWVNNRNKVRITKFLKQGYRYHILVTKRLQPRISETNFSTQPSLKAHGAAYSIGRLRRTSMRHPSVVHRFQKSSPQKPPGRSKPNSLSSIHGIWDRGSKQSSNGPDHVTNMAAMHISDRNPLRIFFSENTRLMNF